MTKGSPAGEPLPPCNLEAEAAALGSILIDPEALYAVMETVTGPDDFYKAEHRAIYAAMLALEREGVTPDLITVVDRLGAQADAESILPSFVSALANQVPTSANAVHYARIVRDKARRRRDANLMGLLAQIASSDADEAAYTDFRRSVADTLINDGDAGDELPILTDAEAEALPPLKGILGDILFDESVSYLYGPSGRWKSFVALDWALSIATGRPWMGRPVIEGDVLYVCSEGARGIGKRITAWKRRHDVSGATRLRVMPLAIDLTNAAHVAALPRRLETLDLTPALMVFDTLAASNSGDENTAENAARITAAARRIIRAHPGVCVLIVHHTGYDNTHMRGSTAFYSNADTVIRIEGGEANRRIEPGEPITIISDKPKEGEPFQDITLTAERQTWADAQGAIHASLVMTPCDASVSKASAKNITPQRKAALAALEAAGQSGLNASAWAKASGMSHGAFYEAIKFFINAQLVEIDAAGNYHCSSAGPVSPVRSGFSPAGPTQSSPVRSGVSIDTGRTGLVSGPASADAPTRRGEITAMQRTTMRDRND